MASRPSQPWAWAVAAIVVVGALAAAVVWVSTRPDESTSHDASAEKTSIDARPHPGAADPQPGGRSSCPVLVYVVAGATQPEVDRVGAAVTAVDGVASAHYSDRTASWRRFQNVFADDPEILESMTPDSLPTSYRVHVAARADRAATVDALEALDLDAIYKVDDSCSPALCEMTAEPKPVACRPAD
jgi:hypothetical protein